MVLKGMNFGNKTVESVSNKLPHFSLCICLQIMDPIHYSHVLSSSDLMLPGLIVKDELSPAALGNLSKGHPCAVKLLGNKSVFVW